MPGSLDNQAIRATRAGGPPAHANTAESTRPRERETNASNAWRIAIDVPSQQRSKPLAKT